jgi:8-oxo-dGTP pyrophosphatase MutT (NUDIX family)
MRRVLVPVACALLLAPAALGAEAPTGPVYDRAGRLVETPLAPAEAPAQQSEEAVTRRFLAQPKVRDWLERYPTKGRTTDAEYTSKFRWWTVHVWSGDAGEIARGRVDDASGLVTEAWTGPQVAWTMARGSPGAFGGKKINSYGVWLAFCALFLLGLVDWRRPLSWRTLDLVALLSFSVSLWFFNRGDIFTSVPLAYPPLLYLIGRGLWVGLTGRATRGRTVWPVWLLLAATVFVAGFRVGLNAQASNVIDVGFAGVAGAQRIVSGEAPYGNMPKEGNLKPCGPGDAEGQTRERIQTNGRCEASNERGDTYGPVSYLAYVPGYLAFGWTGHWDSLPAAHATSIAFDLACLVGLGLVGLRFGGRRLGATLAFAWAAYPFTQYTSSSNTNDSILPAFLIWGFLFVTSSWARGAFTAFAGWTKFAALIVAPMWATYAGWSARRLAAFLGGFAVATLISFWILLLEPDLLEAIKVFWDRTVSWQLGRESPFSLWDWGQYHAGLPDLHYLQIVLEVVVGAAAVAFAFVPRRKTPLQLAALTSVLLLGFEIVLTHWFYLYIPWFFPFAAVAALAPVAMSRPPPGDGRSDDPAVPEYVRRLAPSATAAAAGALILFAGAWWAVHHGWFGRGQIVDVPVYQEYGNAMVQGDAPYRDFAIEYPPGALPVFLLPAVAASATDDAGYRRWFEAEMWACGALLILATALSLRALRAPPRRRWGVLAFVAVSPLLLGSVVLTRFDLWPAALAAGALAALLSHRSRLGHGLLGAAVLAKVWPVVLLPLAVAHVWRTRGRRAALVCLGVFGGTVAAVVLPFLALSPGGVWDSFARQASRPLQIESLGAALTIGAHHVFGTGARMIGSHGSQNLAGGWPDVVAAIQSVLQVGALVGIWIWFARRGGRYDLVRASAAAVVAFVAFGKVLSPQFMIWLVPFVPLVRGRRGLVASGLLGGALVLTQAWFPQRYWEYALGFDGRVTALVVVRDLVLVCLLGVLLARDRRTWDDVPRAREAPFGATVVVRRGDELLVLHRAHEGPDFDGDWAWTPPAGARRPDEAIDDCAARELREEAGLDLPATRLASPHDDWALYVVDAPMDAEVVLDAEHDAYRWVSLEEAVELCRPDKVAALLRAASEVDAYELDPGRAT